MARRRSKSSLVEVVLDGSWVLSALLAGGVLIFGYILVPAILRPSPATTPIMGVIQTLSGWAGVVLLLVAFVKYVLERRNTPSVPDLQVVRTSDGGLTKAPLKTEGNTWNFDEPRRGETLQKSETRRFNILDGMRHQSPAIETQDKTRLARDNEAASGINHSAPIEASVWSKELLQSIEWKRFEDLCAAFYREKGIRSETTPLGADGGIDIRLYLEPENPKVTGIVQCKAWGDKQVGVQYVRELLGVMTHEKIETGFFMAPGGFTDDAREVANANRITLLDSKLFLAMIKRLPAESSQRLLAFATKGEYTIPTCPRCGTKMVNRHGKRGNFWGCGNYPRCKQIMHMRKSVS
jgi:restriction system protein